ncbi:hypothetical protein M3J09_002044 [Ascochyta lentis]
MRRGKRSPHLHCRSNTRGYLACSLRKPTDKRSLA